MKASLRQKLDTLQQRFTDIGGMLSDAHIINNQNRYRELSKEYADLEPLIKCFTDLQNTETQVGQLEIMLNESDPEIRALAEEELKSSQERIMTLEQEIKTLLIPKDPNDERNIFLEIRAGTGGDEAAIFVGDLFRMYSRFAEKKGWRVEVVSQSHGEHGGYKEIITRVIGFGVYSQLKFESGAHRVQRVPLTESSGRIHTSACTVAILPEVEEIDHIDINPTEIRIDTFRSSGAGGQHVNTTDSAVRITHIPTGIVAECQDERSQHKNKAKALTLLQSKILAEQRATQHRERAATRKSLVGSGDRSERIRTYNYPQGRITDHRINLTLYHLNEVMEGSLDSVIEPLTRELQAEQLAELSGDYGG